MTDKTKTTAVAATAAVPAPSPVATPAPAPRLGTTLLVKPAPERELINNDTGLPFAADEAIEVTVTITTLRRLADGDLIAV